MNEEQIKDKGKPGRLGNVSIVLAVSVALTFVVTLLLLVFAVLFYQSERAQRWQQLHRTVSVSADQLAVAVELPLWNLDEKQMQAIMRSILGNRELHAIALTPAIGKETIILRRSAGGAIVSLELEPDDPSLLAERRMVTLSGQIIGAVAVYAEPSVLHAQLRQRALAIGAIIVGLDVILVASIWLLMWWLMLRPLKAIGQYAAAVRAGQPVAAGMPPKTWFLGELRTLYRSIRDMVALLDSRYRALQRSEERVQMATGAASIGIWDWNVAGGELEWDDQMYTQFKADPAAGLPPAMIWRASLLAHDIEPTKQALRAALREGSNFAHEYRILWPDQSIRYIKVDAVLFRDGDGRPMRLVGSNYDITAHREAELELLRHRHHLEELVAERTGALSVAVNQAQAANRAKSVFLANMSHELRTPLNSVIGFSRLMADSPHMQADEKRNLAIIHRSGKHLLTLINEILELSKGEAGKLSAQCEVVALAPLLQEVMDMLGMRAEQHGLQLRLDCASLPPAAHLDGTRLRQVLLNLMSNAVKFAGHGTVTLQARGVCLEAGQWRLEFAVSDTGVGIALHDQQRIFEPFVQADSDGPKDGTGLGLAISREFVCLMKGALTVESTPGQGATFRFAIPARGAELPPVASGSPALPVPQEASPARTLGARDLAVLAPVERAALLAALRELNLTRVAWLLQALPPAAQPLLAPLQAMLEQHQYLPLCALLERDDGPWPS
ncbi:sensor histidine kinase [Janthinobacterium psychrotolerans]|uniref:histidine kinase n=1 Tax=Janthinobacterium psychrotolerans TaxID=1747903 RepID=A0A1A7C080_9BURK|nr:ATP-binding protein [Janthinobacterium psychrotolerans]OBV38409.1 Signal transduction histidine kinase [Janthinobacterium psychrotolerans]